MLDLFGKSLSTILQNSTVTFDDWVPDIVIYHEVVPGFPCRDGIAALWVCHKKYGHTQPFYLGWSYQTTEELGILPDLEYFNNVLIVDYSFSPEIVNSWQARGKTVVIIDHHKSFADSVVSANTISFDYFFSQQECGASLAWQLLYPNEPLPEFLKYIRSRDTFIKDLAYTDIVHLAIGQLARTFPCDINKYFEVFDNLAEMDEDTLLGFLYPIGYPLHQKRLAKVESACKPKNILHWSDIPVVMLAESNKNFKSDVAEYLLLGDYKDLPFCVIINKSKPLEKIRLRACPQTHNFDLLDAFEFFNPSGHTTAVGIHKTHYNELKTCIESKTWSIF